MTEQISNAEAIGSNPYVGLRAFQRKDSKFFFGRDDEIEILMAQVITHQASLFFAKSGVGKSSLLRAGLLPKLTRKQRIGGAQAYRYQKMAVLPILTVGRDIPPSVTESINNIFVFSALLGLLPDDDPNGLAGQTLTKALTTVLARREQAYTLKLVTSPSLVRPDTTLLIFDQFEELFTSHTAHWAEREDFFKDVANVLEQDPTLHILFTIREDYLAELTPYAHLLPDKLRYRFRMERLQRDAAIAAVQNPAELAGRPFAEGVAEALVDNLRRISAAGNDENADEYDLGAYIEPVHLQIVCQDLWEKLPPERSTIILDDVQAFGDVDQALTNFYESALKKVLLTNRSLIYSERAEVNASPSADKTGVKHSDLSERTLRRWFSEKLITPAHTKGLVYRGDSKTEGLPNAVVDSLNNSYLIRAEIRGSDVWYELAHDRLITPILNANEYWQRPAQIITFEVTPQQILVGEEVQLAWEVQDANYIFIDAIDAKPRPLKGNTTHSPYVTTFYMLRAVRETDLPATISNKRRVIVRAHYLSQLHEVLQMPRSPFHGMPLKDLDNFIQRAEIVDYDIGTTIFRTGEPGTSFGVLISGELQIRHYHASPPQVLTRLFAGDIFGIQTLLSENGLHPTTIEAIYDVRIAFFDIDAWKWLQNHYPEIKSKLEQIDVRPQEQDSLTWPGQRLDEVGVLARRPHVISFIFGLGQPIFLLFGLLTIIFIIQTLNLSNAILRYSLWGGTLLLSMSLIFSFVDRYIRWRTTVLILSNWRINYFKLGGLGGGTLQIIDLLTVRDVKITRKSSLISGVGNLLITANNGRETIINHLSYVDEVRESILKERDYALKRDEVERTAMTQLEIAEVMKWPLGEMKVSDDVKREWNFKNLARDRAQKRGRPSKETPNDIIQPILGIYSRYPLYFNKITLTFILSILLAPVVLPVVPAQLQLAWVCVILGCIIWFVKEFIRGPRYTYGRDASCIYKIRRTGIAEYKIIERLASFADIRDVYAGFPSLLFKLLDVGHVAIQIPGKEILLKNYPEPANAAESIRLDWSGYRMRQDEEITRRNIRKTIAEYHELQSILVESTEPVSELDDALSGKVTSR
jgi:hypothetical protein